jgi:EpsI family protein
MPKNTILAVTGLVMVVATFGANHAVGQLKTAVLRRLPVETFPKKIGDWTCITEQPSDPKVAAVLPTAHIVDRVYRDARGREVNLLLLTATDYADFHDPNICFPAQGFTLSPAASATVAGQTGRLMTAARDNSKLQVMYWWSGNAGSDTTYGREQVGKLLALRDRLTGKQGQSLFVRVITSDTPGTDDALNTFVTQSAPALKRLETTAVTTENKDPDYHARQ